MARLELSKKEAAALSKALEHYVSELRMEIVDTDAQSMREELKEEEATLKKIIETLKEKPS